MRLKYVCCLKIRRDINIFITLTLEVSVAAVTQGQVYNHGSANLIFVLKILRLILVRVKTFNNHKYVIFFLIKIMYLLFF